ncbi:MAG: hypothetical protein H5T49_00500 [Hadesarchaea archaeon]|nr:hypothetical protein [Hadesarchaea archaeon]
MKVKSKLLQPASNVCSECGGRLIHDYAQGSLICSGCGYVAEEREFDYGPEWRAYNEEQKEERIRAGPPVTLTIHDKGLSTTISSQDRDIRDRNFTPERRAQIYRLRKWQRRLRVSDVTERNLAFALSEIDRMASQLALPRNVKEAAALIYRRALEKKMIRGRSIEAMVAAALYAACQEYKIPRTLTEVAEASRVSKTEVNRGYMSIARGLSIPPVLAASVLFVPKIASELKLNGEVQALAARLAQRCEKRKITQMCDPRSIAAATVYLASVLCGKKLSQQAVADVLNLSEVTVRNAQKRICNGLRIKLPNQPIEKPRQKQQRARASLSVQNIVASIDWNGEGFNLKWLSERLKKNEMFWDVLYDPKKFPGLVLKLKSPPVSFLLFKSGKANCVGAKSTKEVRKAVSMLTRTLREAGLRLPEPRIAVQNVVLSFNLGKTFDVEKIIQKFKDAEYNPEIFPGVTVRLKDPKAEILIFSSGRGVCTGAKSVAIAKRAVKKFSALVR